MIQWKKDNLPTRQEKEAAAKKQQEHEQLPDRVAEMEDALCGRGQREALDRHRNRAV